MNQDPPVLIPYVEKELYPDISTNSISHTCNQEPLCNGFLSNGNKSPPMPTLYEADRDPPPLFNIQDIFSALTKDSEYTDSREPCSEPRHSESDSLFEKIYKDYCSTLNSSSNQINSSKNSIISQLESNLEVIKTKNETEEVQSGRESQEIDISIATQSETVAKDTPKRPKRKKAKRTINQMAAEEAEEDLGKYGIKTMCNKKSKTRNIEGPPARDNGDCKYLKSPFIALRHRGTPKKPGTSVISEFYEIVNPALRGSAASENHAAVYRPNLKAFPVLQSTSSTSATASSVCALCGLSSAFLQLGSLYGPYFIDRDFVHTLPLTAIFPSESNEIGVSGKSAIKSDKNGNVKMVIQQTRGTASSSSSSRQSGGKKQSVVAVADYRVTWDGELWLHRECVLWAPGTYLRGDGKIGALDEALKMALNAECFVCHKIGAILNCTTKNCEKNFHYYCAVSEGSKMNNEQLSVLCSKHKER